MDSEPNRVNVVTCTAWVPRGEAKENPEKVEVTKEELEKILRETSENLGELENVPEDEYTELEVEALEEDMKVSSKSKKKKKKNKEEKCEDVEMEEACNGQDEKENKKKKSSKKSDDEDEEDIEKRYDLDSYDVEKDGLDSLLKLGRLTMHADVESDPLIVRKEDEESEVEDNKILPTDNLVTVGHVDGDAAILEVYVYNSEEGSVYVHHDILLPAVPLCMEWLNYDPEAESLKGNLVAIGSMSPIVEVWDLNLIDSLEPAFTLGRKPKKKKKITRMGHSDAVLSLAWNKNENFGHILASGSVDKSVILWDLQECKESQRVDCGGKVQDLKWHLTNEFYLLAGSCDKRVKLLDFSTEGGGPNWMLDGEVESLVWNPAAGYSNNFFASTDTGSVYSIDIRQTKPLERIEAHQKTCTGILMNSACPGCLVTVSEDETMKVYDVLPSKAVLVEERPLHMGVLHGVSCSPDSPFVLSFAGDNRHNNFKIWDMRRSRKVRQGFFDRLGLPVDDGEENDDGFEPVQKREDEGEEEEALEELGASGLAGGDCVDMEDSSALASGAAARGGGWKPKKKSTKKKGGHLDGRRRR